MTKYLDQSFLWRRLQNFAGRIAEHLLGARRVRAAGRSRLLDLSDEHQRADQEHDDQQAAAGDDQQKEQIEVFTSGRGPGEIGKSFLEGIQNLSLIN